jgi:hypothetical protein
LSGTVIHETGLFQYLFYIKNAFVEPVVTSQAPALFNISHGTICLLFIEGGTQQLEIFLLLFANRGLDRQKMGCRQEKDKIYS